MNKYQFYSILLLSSCLSACTSTQSALTIKNEPVAVATGTSAAVTTTMPPTRASAISAQNLYIASIIGAPLNIADPLTKRLNQTAQAHGLTVTGTENSPSTHILKGYFSALADAGQTTILYVWDVLDPAGNRLHRIQGEQKVQGTTADSWGAVTPNAIAAIANQTIEQYQNWRNNSKS